MPPRCCGEDRRCIQNNKSHSHGSSSWLGMGEWLSKRRVPGTSPHLSAAVAAWVQDTSGAAAGTRTCRCSQHQASFLCSSHENPYTARLLPLQTLCLHCFASKKPARAADRLTPPTATQHWLLQRNAASRTSLLVLPLPIHSSGPQPGEGHLLSVSMATPPAGAEFERPPQSFSFVRDPDLLQQGPTGCSGVAPAHSPRGGRSLPLLQGTTRLGSPFPLHIPPGRAPLL